MPSWCESNSMAAREHEDQFEEFESNQRFSKVKHSTSKPARRFKDQLLERAELENHALHKEPRKKYWDGEIAYPEVKRRQGSIIEPYIEEKQIGCDPKPIKEPKNKARQKRDEPVLIQEDQREERKSPRSK